MAAKASIAFPVDANADCKAPRAPSVAKSAISTSYENGCFCYKSDLVFSPWIGGPHGPLLHPPPHLSHPRRTCQTVHPLHVPTCQTTPSTCRPPPPVRPPPPLLHDPTCQTTPPVRPPLLSDHLSDHPSCQTTPTCQTTLSRPPVTHLSDHLSDPPPVRPPVRPPLLSDPTCQTTPVHPHLSDPTCQSTPPHLLPPPFPHTSLRILPHRPTFPVHKKLIP